MSHRRDTVPPASIAPSPKPEFTAAVTETPSASSWFGSATRVDRKVGTRDEIGFFGEGPAKLLGALHLPPGKAAAGVVVCSPIGEELLRNHRREVLLGRALATAGIAVLRFHYRGSGSSDGEAIDLTVDTMLEDALSATTLLQQRAGVDRLGFVGTRLAALTAATAAARLQGAPLALWEPATEGRRYVDEVLRARLVRGLQDDGAGAGEGGGAEGQSDDLSDLRRDGIVDVLGYPISLPLYESAVRRRLVEEAGPGARPVLLAQVGPRQRFRHEYARLSEEWRSKGWEVETLTFVYPGEAWWFAAPDDTIKPGTRMRAQSALLEATRDWLVRHLVTEAGA